MKLSERIGKVPPYIFVQISRKIAAKKAEGIEVISFGIGDPDIPTPSNILGALHEASLDPPNHRYPESEGLPEFRQSVADWYKRRFGVTLDPETEVLSLIGAKEGIGHAAFCFIDPGDIALVPDPGYPVYGIGTLFAGGSSYIMPLTKDNNWLPDFEAIPRTVADKATVMWLNYPNNPTGAIADREFFKRAIKFAKDYNIAVMHDACYTEVAYDGYQPPSFLEIEGAKDVGLEFHSLSKSYNMTGWRIGMVAGNQEMISALLTIKSNLDSGVAQAVQHMAIEGLRQTDESIEARNSVYQSRRDRIIPVLRDMGMRVIPPKASLYIWAGIPDGYTSAEFAEKVLDDTDVLMIPGGSYGEAGEGYVRLSVTLSDSLIDTALERLAGWQG